MGTRRDNGAGTDEKREDKYSTRVMVDGRRYRITADTKRELERKKRDLLHNADRGILPVRERWTLAQWIDRWLQDVVRRSVRTRTYEFYGDIMRLHVLPALGRIRLADCNPHTRRSCTAICSSANFPPRRSATFIRSCTHVWHRPRSAILSHAT